MLQTTQLIGFGAGVSGGLSALTSITAAMWDGSVQGLANWTRSNDDISKTATTGGGFNNIRIKHATAPVLDGDFVWQYTQTGDMGGNTDSSYGFFDITEDSTWSQTAFMQGLNSMSNSYWFDATTGTRNIETFEGSTSKTSSINFSVNDQFKWQRTGTTLTLSIAGSVVQTWTGTSETLRFCVSGFTVNKADLSDIQFQN
tara:strand:- start:294 stop:893 length:600 start_codon:yes stop_codon:yes gene_type:complete